MIKKHFKQSLGFTLLELIFSLGIIVLFLTISIPLFRGPSENNKLILTSEEIKEGILRAHNLSISPDKEKKAEAELYVIRFGQFPTDGVQEGFLITERDNLGNDLRIVERLSLPAGINIFDVVLQPGSESLVPGEIFELIFSIEQQGKIIPSSSLYLSSGNLAQSAEIILRNKLNSKQTVKVDSNTGKIEILNLIRP